LDDPIAEGDRVSLQYKGTQLFVIVTRVVAPQETYEGRVQAFVTPEPVFEIEDLKAGCIVGFRHDDIGGVE
jgi:alpha-acetolactate decarboxylase